MTSVEVTDVQPLAQDVFEGLQAGQTAKLITSGVELHPELADILPLETKLTPLTSIGDEHVYHVSVRGYTVEQFRQIALAYAAKDFQKAEGLIEAIHLDRTEG